MFRKNLIITLRTFLKQKAFLTINILGLTIGLACSVFILLWVQKEFRFDKFHENYDKIYLLRQTFTLEDGEYTTDRVGGVYANLLKQNFPEVIESSRFITMSEVAILYQPNGNEDSTSNIKNEKLFIENNVCGVDPSLFHIFTFPFLKGNPEAALSDPYSIILTMEMAEKYFGNEDPIGKTIRLDNTYNLVVTAVVHDVPDNSTLQFDFLVSITFLKEYGYQTESYEGNPFLTYLLLNETQDIEQLYVKIPTYIQSIYEPKTKTTFSLMAFKRTHLHGESRTYLVVYIFTIIGVLILLIACINFINLSTARYTSRSKEVGIKKVVGARRFHLIRQFIGESILITFIALNIALIILELFINKFNTIFDDNISIKYTDPIFLLILLGIVVFTGVVAGSYPAFILSSFKPISVLRNSIVKKSKGVSIRKILVVIQFFVSIVIMITALANYLQLNYLSNNSFGIDKKNVIFMPVRGEIEKNYNGFKTKLLENTNIENVTSASTLPDYVNNATDNWGLEKDKSVGVAMHARVGYDFVETFNLTITEGRFYSPLYPTDTSTAIVLNESAVKKLGIDDPVGKQIYIDDEKIKIIGVIKDYNCLPLSLAGKCLLIDLAETSNYVFVKVKSENYSNTLQYIETIHKSFNPGYPIEYYSYARHENEIITELTSILNLFMFFTILGIFISCLGLFGLATYTAEQKTKEIGIRKAFGASFNRIIMMLSKEFIILIMISYIIALPIAYFLNTFILKQFDERIDLTSWIFVVPAIIVIFLAFVSVSYQALTASMRNPVDSLRYE